MTTDPTSFRYERTNIRPAYVTIEEEQASRKHRAYISEGPTPARESYREGTKVWTHCADAQVMRFDLKDTQTGEIIKLDELLGLMYYASAKPESDIYKMGELAQKRNIHVYIGITSEGKDELPTPLPLEKLLILNQAFNERLRTQNKMILILPDHFGLYQDLTYGEIMMDFAMTSMEARNP